MTTTTMMLKENVRGLAAAQVGLILAVQMVLESSRFIKILILVTVNFTPSMRI